MALTLLSGPAHNRCQHLLGRRSQGRSAVHGPCRLSPRAVAVAASPAAPPAAAPTTLSKNRPQQVYAGTARQAHLATLQRPCPTHTLPALPRPPPAARRPCPPPAPQPPLPPRCPPPQADALEFRQAPTYEDCFPGSTKEYREVLHQESGELLRVGAPSHVDSCTSSGMGQLVEAAGRSRARQSDGTVIHPRRSLKVRAPAGSKRAWTRCVSCTPHTRCSALCWATGALPPGAPEGRVGHL